MLEVPDRKWVREAATILNPQLIRKYRYKVNIRKTKETYSLCSDPIFIIQRTQIYPDQPGHGDHLVHAHPDPPIPIQHFDFLIVILALPLSRTRSFKLALRMRRPQTSLASGKHLEDSGNLK